MRMRALSFLAASALTATAWLGTASAAPAPTAPAASPIASPAAAAAGPMWATQLQFDNNGAALVAGELRGVEGERPAPRPRSTCRGAPSSRRRARFSFTELDQELANASAAGIKLIPIFWYSGWGGSPASWVTGREADSTGASSAGSGLVGPDVPARVLRLRHQNRRAHSREHRLRRQHPGLRIPRRAVGPQRRHLGLGPGRRQRIPHRLPAEHLRHHRGVQQQVSDLVRELRRRPGRRDRPEPVGRLPGLPRLERAGHLWPAHRGGPRSHRLDAAVLLLRRPLRQRGQLRQHPRHLLRPGQAVHGHGDRGRRAVPRPRADLRQPGARLRRPAGAGVDRAR